jgi:hypothetical protein
MPSDLTLRLPGAAAAIPGAAASPRTALAIGLVGALGEALLAQLVGGSHYAATYVAVDSPISSATARFRPWLPGRGVIAVDDAYIGLTGEETFVPAGSVLTRCSEDGLLDAAALARRCGARRLTVVAPLSALLQMNPAARVLAPQAQIALREMGFEHLLIVRPTAADAPATTGLRGLVTSVGRAVADIMLPASTRVLSARTAARAIALAARAPDPSGAAVLGARELLQLVQSQMPQLAPRVRRRW